MHKATEKADVDRDEVRRVEMRAIRDFWFAIAKAYEELCADTRDRAHAASLLPTTALGGSLRFLRSELANLR